MRRELPRIPISKRVLDVALCLAALPVLGPVMLAAAVVVKLSSEGPVLYKAPRAGYKGQLFHAYKFRTMHVGADRHGAFTAKGDHRVFPAGRYLRLFKIDELPQVFNILRGEMSAVGPRPEDFQLAQECYSPEQRKVLEAPPGLTGLPQVRYFPELSVIDNEGMEPQEYYRKVILPMRLEMDLEYVRRQSFWLDCYLIAATLYLILVKSWLILIFGQKPAVLARSS